MDRPGDLVRVLVGPGLREFVVHRKLLCASSAVFCNCIDSAAALAEPASLPTPPLSSDPILVPWLAAESAGMFEIFVLWLYRRHAFRNVINEALTVLMAAGEEVELLPEQEEEGLEEKDKKRKWRKESKTARACTDLHWNLVHAHLFAARAEIPAFQDAVMDALQDLYLRLDWEATPRLVRFLYVDCPDPVAASRLRKWVVPLLAWTLANGVDEEEEETEDVVVKEAKEAMEDEGEQLDVLGNLASDESLNISNERSLRRLLSSLPDLRAEYDAQLAKLAVSGADVRFKNPQLRIPSNRLRREDRLYGFRQCAFHSHRRSVGQGRCPHSPVLVHYHHHHQRRGLRGHRRAAHSADETTAASARRRPVTPPTSSSMSMSITVPESSVASTFSSPVLSSPALSFFPPITTSEPRLIDLPAWSPLSVTTPGLAPLGMELTI